MNQYPAISNLCVFDVYVVFLNAYKLYGTIGIGYVIHFCRIQNQKQAWHMIDTQWMDA
jgi:hypothetical protein